MKQLLLICAVVALVGCGKKPLIFDTAVEKAIRLEIHKHEGELTEEDYEKVTYLNLRRLQLTSVKGLEKLKLTKLERLNLHNNQLTEVPKDLEKLTQLKKLNLGANQLTDVKGLEKLTQLTTLKLIDNQLTDVKGLEKLTGLTILSLNSNPDLTKAQIDELKKALPNCIIVSDFEK